MGLIKFKDYPDTSTPLNAENLNNNFNEIKIEEITLLTAKEGFEIYSQKFFKQGRHIWGDAVIKSNESLTSSYRSPATLKYAIPYVYNSYCGLFMGPFGNQDASIGYFFVNENDVNSMLVADDNATGNPYIKVHLDYVIN